MEKSLLDPLQRKQDYEVEVFEVDVGTMENLEEDCAETVKEVMDDHPTRLAHVLKCPKETCQSS